MILSEEKLEQLVCQQLSIDRKMPCLFTAKFGLIWAEVSYQSFKGQRFHSLWYGKIEQGQRVYRFAGSVEGDDITVLPDGVLNYDKTLECRGVFMNNQYFCLLAGTDGRQRIIPKRNLNWDNVRRERYYGSSILPTKGNLVRAESEGKKFLAWVYYDDARICSFFNIEDSQWLEPSAVTSWRFELRKVLCLGQTKFRCENKCIERCDFK